MPDSQKTLIWVNQFHVSKLLNIFLIMFGESNFLNQFLQGSQQSISKPDAVVVFTCLRILEWQNIDLEDPGLPQLLHKWD